MDYTTHKNWLFRSESVDFSPYDVHQMSEQDCFWRFVQIRFGSTTHLLCPHCGGSGKHYFRKKERRWTCRDCHSIFSPTSGTILHGRKLSYQKIVLGIAHMVTSANGISSLRMRREIRVHAKTAFVFGHKLREAMFLTHEIPLMHGLIEVDGGHFGGRPRSGRLRKRPNTAAIAAKISEQLSAQNEGRPKPKYRPTKANRKRLKNRRIIFNIRQHSGNKGFGAVRTFVTVINAETAAEVRPHILKMVAPGSTIYSDENAAYTWLESAGYVHEVVNHQVEFSTLDGVNENQAEAFFSRLRRYVLGVAHRIEPKYMLDYAVEMAWREDRRRTKEGDKNSALTLGLSKPYTSKWRGYFQSIAVVNLIEP